MAPTQSRKRSKSPKQSSAKRVKTQPKNVIATVLGAAILFLVTGLGFKGIQQAAESGLSVPDPSRDPQAACHTIIASVKTGSVTIDDSVTQALRTCVEYDGPGAKALLREISTLGTVKPDQALIDEVDVAFGLAPKSSKSTNSISQPSAKSSKLAKSAKSSKSTKGGTAAGSTRIDGTAV